MRQRSKRAGRPAGDGGNRATILAAARELFAKGGFQATTMRGIAAAAGFDVALVAHYFGNKETLFAATIELPDDAGPGMADALASPPGKQGEALARFYLKLWEDRETGGQMRALARAALGSDAGGVRMRGLLDAVAEEPCMAPMLGSHRTGFFLALSYLLGVAVARHLTRTRPVAEIDFETLIALVAPAIQSLLDTPDGRGMIG